MSDGSLKPYLLPYFNFIGNTMSRRGLTYSDTSGYGFYNVRLREGLRQYLLPDSVLIDTAALEVDEDAPIIPIGTQDKGKTLFDRLFPSKKDTVVRSAVKVDTTKTKKQIRQERRAERRKEKEGGG